MVNRLKNRSDRDRKRGFVYTPRDPKVMKEHSEQSGGMFDSIFKQGIDRWTPKVGDNDIRILPPTWEGAEYHALQAWVHSRVGADNSTYLCPRKMDKSKSCPICDAAREAKEAGEDEEAKALNAKQIYISWIIDRDESKPTPQIYQYSWNMDREISSQAVDNKTGKILVLDHPDKGYDVYFKRQGQGLKTKYVGVKIARDDSPIDDDDKTQEEILDYITENPLPDVLKFYDNEYLEKVISGTAEKKDADLDDDRKGRRRRGRDDDDEKDDDRSSRRGRRDKDEEDEDRPRSRRGRDDEEEEEEERPKRRRGRDEEEDDEDDKGGKTERVRSRRDDDDKEDDEPKSRRRRGSDDDDDKEDEESRPRRRGRDEEDEEPEEKGSHKSSRKGRDESDDDEAPKGRRRGKDSEEEDEEDQERPRSRKGRDDAEEDKPRRRNRDEEDDEPKSRRRSRDDDDDKDDEEEERPRRGRR